MQMICGKAAEIKKNKNLIAKSRLKCQHVGQDIRRAENIVIKPRELELQEGREMWQTKVVNQYF